METSLNSLSKIFNERIFRIPDYQRGYAWKTRQLKDFWNDLNVLEDGKNHYIGVLTLEDIPSKTYESWHNDLWIINSKSYHPYYIVDGQQRLTTSIILIQCILEQIEDENKLNFTSKEDIQRKFIFDSKDDTISRSYIFGYEKDNPSYNFLKTEVFCEEADTLYKKEETIYTHNLENAKEYFKLKLKELDFSIIEKLYKKLTQNFLFNIYAISDDIDVFVAFETMNNRGKPLSHLELLKNRLIFLSTKFNKVDSEKVTLRHRINECWKAIYHNLGRNKNNPLDDDTFLVNHFLIYFGSELFDEEKNTSHARISNLKRYYRDRYSSYLLEKKFTSKNLNIPNKGVTIQEIDDYVNNLQSSVVIWYKLFNPKLSGLNNEVKHWLDKLNRQDKNMSLAPLLMVYFQKEKNTKKRVELLKLLETYNFLTSLYSYIYYRGDPEAFMQLAIDLNENKIDSIKLVKTITRRVSELSVINKALWGNIIKEFKTRGFYKWDGIRYFLYEYDLHLSEQSKTSREKLIWEDYDSRDYETVEHIYPQNGRKQCWVSVFKKHSQKERNMLKNSLGNLLPLSRSKNSSFSNKCFNEKIGVSNSTIGYRFGCYAENKITEYDKWDAETILNRGIELLNFMETRWNIKIGNEKDKINFLNLSFVNKQKTAKS